MPIIGSQWFLTRTGECATPSLEAGGFIRSSDESSHPDIQLHFLPFAVKDHGRKFPDGHAYQVCKIFLTKFCKLHFSSIYVSIYKFNLTKRLYMFELQCNLQILFKNKHMKHTHTHTHKDIHKHTHKYIHKDIHKHVNLFTRK